VKLFDSRFQEIDALAAAGKLSEAVIAAEGLSISAIRKNETDAVEVIARRLCGILPRLRITTSRPWGNRRMLRRFAVTNWAGPARAGSPGAGVAGLGLILDRVSSFRGYPHYPIVRSLKKHSAKTA